MFKPLRKRYHEIVNVDSRGIQDKIITMGWYAETATLLDLLDCEISWTTDSQTTGLVQMTSPTQLLLLTTLAKIGI